MIELLAAAALYPWAHPLAFRQLPGWRTAASGNVVRTPSTVVLRDFLLKPSGILFGMHPTEARIVVIATALAPLKVCEVGTTFSTYWNGGCRRLVGRPMALPTSGGAVHIGFRVMPSSGRPTRVRTLRVRWHCVDHYFGLLRGTTAVRAVTPTFDC
jgi:hypothetical protein